MATSRESADLARRRASERTSRRSWGLHSCAPLPCSAESDDLRHGARPRVLLRADDLPANGDARERVAVEHQHGEAGQLREFVENAPLPTVRRHLMRRLRLDHEEVSVDLDDPVDVARSNLPGERSAQLRPVPKSTSCRLPIAKVSLPLCAPAHDARSTTTPIAENVFANFARA